MINEKIFNVQGDDVNLRLDIFLNKNLKDITRSKIKKLASQGNVFLNDKPLKRVSYLVKNNDIIKIVFPEVETIDLTPQDVEFEVVYEDEDLAVINKPQGLVVHPSETTRSHTLVNGLLLKFDKLSDINGAERPGIVHRLDKDTSGLLVIAKNNDAHISLQKQIAEKSAQRIYRAIVDGNIKEDNGIVDQPIGRSKRNRKIMAVVDNGRNAVTEYRVLERFGQYTYVEYSLKTGRTHQIRVHTKYLHHPVVGDTAYGGSNKFKLNGQLLHAYKLSFVHPKTNEFMVFEAPLPIYFDNILKNLRNK